MTPSETVAIEDSPNGLRSAVASGAAVIGVPLMVSIAGAGAHTVWPTLEGRTAQDVASFHAAPLHDERSRPMTERPSGPFRIGDRVQLTGPKGRLSTITLRADGELHTHHGVLRHTALIGQPDGSVVANSAGHEYLALRPLLRDFVMSMPRGAAIVYPKDAAQILAEADVFPGAVVVEAGVGSGALSLWLLRSIGESGRLVSFERRAEFADVARANVETYSGGVPANWDVVVGDLVEALPQVMPPASVDRVILDMLAPWECIEAVAEALTPGGVVLCYIATATQLSRVAEFIRGDRPVHRPRGERDDGARLARRGARGAARPSDDRPHRLPAVGSPARAGSGAARGQAARVQVELRRRGRRAVDPGRRRGSPDHRQEPAQARARSPASGGRHPPGGRVDGRRAEPSV